MSVWRSHTNYHSSALDNSSVFLVNSYMAVSIAAHGSCLYNVHSYSLSVCITDRYNMPVIIVGSHTLSICIRDSFNIPVFQGHTISYLHFGYIQHECFTMDSHNASAFQINLTGLFVRKASS